MTKQNLKRHGTKTAFLTSLLSLILCVTMLAGTTLAWFTDSVTSGNNIITAGNLDIGLQYKNDTQNVFKDVDMTTNVFKENTLWEPGHVEYAVLNIQNLGTLALKYKLAINIASETGSISAATNTDFKLSAFLKYAVLEGDQSTLTRDEMVTAAEAASPALLNSAYTTNGTMTAGQADKVVTFVVWMPSTVGNEANYKTGAAVPQITLGIALSATQLENESDSFDNTYDAAATYATLADVVNKSESYSGNFAQNKVATGTGESTQVTANEDIILTGSSTTLIPAGTTLFTANGENDEPITTDNGNAEGYAGSIVSNIKTTDTSSDSVTYQISYTYTEGDTSTPVSKFSNIVTNVFDISKGLKDVKVYTTHNGGTETALTSLSTNTATDKSFYYDSTTGKLYIYSSEYSSFRVTYASDYVASVNGTGYATLDAAFDAAKQGGTVILLKDTDLSSTIEIADNITFDMQGKTVTVSSTGYAFEVKASEAGKTFTVNNGTFAGSGNPSGVAQIASGSATANLVFTGVNIYGATANDTFTNNDGVIADNTTDNYADSITLTNVNINTAGDIVTGTGGRAYASLTVTGGTFVSSKRGFRFCGTADSTSVIDNANITTSNGIAVYAHSNATLKNSTINMTATGNNDAVAASAAYNTGATLTVENTTITANGTAASAIAAESKGNVVINSGTFKNNNGDKYVAKVSTSGGRIIINGGTFGTEAQMATQTVLFANTLAKHDDTQNPAGITVNDGIFYGGVGVSSDHASVDIKGGTFKSAVVLQSGTGQHVLLTNDCTATFEGAVSDSGTTVTIPGGTFKGTVTLTGSGSSITGGTFNYDYASYVKAGYTSTSNGDGTYTVTANS